MFGRFLLTLLALLTGIAAQGTPLEARAASRAEVGAVASNATAGDARVSALVREAGVKQKGRVQVHSDRGPYLHLAWRAPTVRTGIDQSRE